MYSTATREQALRLLASGATISQVSRELAISRAAIKQWRDHPTPSRPSGCPRCDPSVVLDTPSYAALRGFYLGDGCLSAAKRYYALRISCDAVHPGVVDDVSVVISRVRPTAGVVHVRAPGCTVVQSNWQHRPCLFPQHGPGRKHLRPIVLEPWQRTIVEDHSAAFLRGLFHSDGCRVKNWATRMVAGKKKRYDYPRWQFVNESADIRELCCWALDLVEIAWRPSNRKTISVSRRADVARLDSLIGLKS
ncbi:hypothetical protein GCM10027020_08680 [Nocardioides salsibiostraticola]